MPDLTSSSDIALVTRAAAYAAEAHVKQKRKAGDEPYINHPLRVAQAAAEVGLDAEAIAAALLHDVVEDTGRTLDDLAAHFPPRTLDLVRRMTKWWPDDASAAVKLEGNPRYYGAILEDPAATAIKLLDRADNLWSMVRMLPQLQDWAQRYYRKSQEEVAPLAEVAINREAAARFTAAHRALAAALENSKVL